MPYSVPISANIADQETKHICDEIRSVCGIEDTQRLPNWVSYLCRYPKQLGLLWTVTKAGILENPLNPLLKELVLVYIGKKQNSNYCVAHHSLGVMRLLPSLSEEQLLEIIDGRSYAAIPERFAVALKTLEDLSNVDCSKIAETSLAEMRNSGFEDSEISNFVSLVSSATFFSQTMRIAGIPLDDDVGIKIRELRLK